MRGNSDDVISSIDVSVAFLQSMEYDVNDEPRYVYYKPHSRAKSKYYILRGPIYGQRVASKKWHDTLVEYLTSKGFVQGKD